MKSIERRIQKLATSLKIEVNLNHFIEHIQNDNGEDSIHIFDSLYMHFPYINGDFSFLKDYEKLMSLTIDIDQEINIVSLKDCINLEYLNINFDENYTNKINFNGDFSFPKIKNLNTGSAIIESNNSLSFLKKFPNLERLEINLTNISDISDLGKLSKLKSLSLHQGTFSSIDCISKLTHLEALYLNSENIKDFSPLKKLTKIVHLTIHTCNFKDTSVLSHFKNLQTLSLAFNKIQDIEELRSLSDLTTINLSHNAVKSIDAITELPNLVNINVSSNEITEIPQLKSSKITHAYFSNNSITSIENLATINSLQYLDITDNRIEKITQLPKNLVQLRANNNAIEELQAGNHQHLLHIHCENHFIKKPENLSLNSRVLQYINLKQKKPSFLISGEFYENGGSLDKKFYHLFKLHGDHFFKKKLFDQAYKTYEKFVLLKNIIACRKIEQHLLDETPQTFDTLFNHIDTFMQTKKESNRIYDLVGNKKVLEYTSEMIALRIKSANISKEKKQELYYKLLNKIYPNTDNETPKNTLMYTQTPTLKSKDDRFIARVELFFWIVGIVSFLIMIIILLKIFLFR
ncbi:leucine-rich repeat domain-containing protein [uncultured Kordia sp.]|uniref:leucine-rich repeat domain-containing protein n=1 Tax=uncultured Kordia sp. TaxID=507699 RepID=UPI0026056697|nr:leucine-rich repeat domain-containing protein [uncultured Kordia sp.]